ncbi:GNAT family N-acetyltransferase [Actinomycetospora straminea]|uniref:N-acetyltransferase domain-containing protein n=1 Tax=Actinomycetospora straminea TaxID=663607 RepID=A0ABP9DSB1_9PSEU|nr:GNAT family N-acetyltransferase [Actinomycetospora straminea]MDD7935246.1 GNAT family N-acetyltransferase [Actinomycetospora straminea]
MYWTLRRAVDADADRIGEITVAGWRHAYRGIVADDRLDALDPAEVAERRREAIAAPEPMAVFVADDEQGRVRGYCTVGPSTDPDLAGDTTAATSGVLYTLYLDPEVIGTGAGGLLHDAGVAHLAAAGFARATLWVYTANTSAQAFYAHRGWYADGEPYQGPGWSAPATRWAKDL